MCKLPRIKSIQFVFSPYIGQYAEFFDNGDVCDRINKEKTSMALVLFGEPYKGVVRNASQSTRTLYWALGEPYLGNNLLCTGVILAPWVFGSWKALFGTVVLHNNTNRIIPGLEKIHILVLRSPGRVKVAEIFRQIVKFIC